MKEDSNIVMTAHLNEIHDHRHMKSRQSPMKFLAPTASDLYLFKNAPSAFE